MGLEKLFDHPFRRLARLRGKTREVRIELKDYRHEVGTALGKSEDGDLLIKIRQGKIRDKRRLIHGIIQIGDRVDVTSALRYDVTYDYVGEDLSKKVPISRKYVGEEIVNVAPRQYRATYV